MRQNPQSFDQVLTATYIFVHDTTFVMIPTSMTFVPDFMKVILQFKTLLLLITE